MTQDQAFVAFEQTPPKCRPEPSSPTDTPQYPSLGPLCFYKSLSPSSQESLSFALLQPPLLLINATARSFRGKMVYQEGEYSDEVFRNIPFARDAFGYVDENPMPEEAIDDLRAVFLNHKQEHALGLSILHRHFDIQPHEKVVEYENVATPWTVPSYLPLLRGKIASRSWAFIDNILYPYEFLYVPDQASKSYAPNLPELDEDFVHELRDVLTKHQLEKVYGLALLPADAQDESAPSRLEFTAGRANVTVPMTEEMYETATIATGYLFPCIDPLLPGGYRGPKIRHCWTCVRH